MSRLLRVLLLLSVLTGGAVLADSDDDFVPQAWRELEVPLPGIPADQNLQPFYVSAVEINRFYLDTESLSIGADGVVRFVLVVLTPGGARNVTFEGMRCETRERRLYASGRQNGVWSKARSVDWQPINDAAINRHHAALFLDYLCPGGVMASSVAEIKGALRRTGYQITP
ncbi:MAG: hypothetical protein F9K30_04875 [Dechloromonas sp.]|nr:MAG: hypothetical protein F9K30_04875 [Dechloromonas sp.]